MAQAAVQIPQAANAASGHPRLFLIVLHILFSPKRATLQTDLLDTTTAAALRGFVPTADTFGILGTYGIGFGGRRKTNRVRDSLRGVIPRKSDSAFITIVTAVITHREPHRREARAKRRGTGFFAERHEQSVVSRPAALFATSVTFNRVVRNLFKLRPEYVTACLISRFLRTFRVFRFDQIKENKRRRRSCTMFVVAWMVRISGLWRPRSRGEFQGETRSCESVCSVAAFACLA